ncbi:MAG: tRNA (adenosine(37)-N6)-threonylcarbamoyltransferase complex dimerization subunit type 1 TsaB [Thermoguttaceae bacterium]
MKILALETTDKVGGVAALCDANVLAELDLDKAAKSAQSLLPAMRQLLQQVGWTPQDVRLVAVSIGPGSFTGLRVGATAAKVFAYSVGAEVMAVSTLETIAAGATATPGQPLSVVLDAQRGDVVTQWYALRDAQTVEPLGPEELIPADVWLARLTPGSLVTGPALGRLVHRLPAGVMTLPPDCWRPRAAVVGRLAARYHGQGRRDDLWKLAPRYFRRSAAEEKWDAMGKP